MIDRLIRDEPLRVYLYTVVAAGVALIAAFVDLTGAQIAAVGGFGAAVLGFGEVARRHVTPVGRRAHGDAGAVAVGELCLIVIAVAVVIALFWGWNLNP